MYTLFTFFYAYSFWFGGKLKKEEAKLDPNEIEYTGGRVFGVFVTVLLGTFMLGSGLPHIKAVIEAKVAGKMTFEVLDQKHKIKVCDPRCKELTEDNC